MKYIFTIFLALSLIFVSHTQADEYSNDKYYINGESFVIMENAMFLHINGAYFPISNLHSDERGLYTLTNELLEWDDFFGWKCPTCKYINGTGHNCCQFCGKRRPG